MPRWGIRSARPAISRGRNTPVLLALSQAIRARLSHVMIDQTSGTENDDIGMIH